MIGVLKQHNDIFYNGLINVFQNQDNRHKEYLICLANRTDESNLHLLSRHYQTMRQQESHFIPLVWTLYVTAAKPQNRLFFKEIPLGLNFIGEAVSYLTLRIKVIYSQLSKELAHRMILTSVGSEITLKPVTVSEFLA